MKKKLIFNEHGQRGTQAMIGGNTTNPVYYTHLDVYKRQLQFPGEDLQKGGLAGAVGADDAVAIALDKLQVHMGEKGLAAVLKAEVGNGNHRELLYS